LLAAGSTAWLMTAWLLLLLSLEDWGVCRRLLLIGWLRIPRIQIPRIRLLIWVLLQRLHLPLRGWEAGCGVSGAVGVYGLSWLFLFCLTRLFVRSFVRSFFCTNGVEERVRTSWEGECEDYMLNPIFS
jgi:hypothetical protein